ncbi:PREDICTED: spermatogenesis associated 6-like protein [Capra hircus]|uniref:spermatogenesis associated 6-like protein n=1 Tax=Capra hircus TaxID=9925 RepID=UPI00084762BD|nr:PREDICTED: spermatogenesis associated 6-like protein [Capra hircus]
MWALDLGEERCMSRRPLSTPNGPKFPLSCVKMKPRESNLDRVPPGVQSRPLSPYCTRRFFQDQPAQLNLGYTFKIPGESKPPFVVRHVDSAKPFGENSSQHHSQKSRRKPNFSNFPFPVRRASSLDSLGANVKETSFDTSQHSRSPSPLLDQPLLRERPHPGSQSTWKKIHERVCSLLTSHRAQQHLNKEESISEVQNILDRPGYPLKKYRAHEQKYF